jgi:RecA-family ATPase
MLKSKSGQEYAVKSSIVDLSEVTTEKIMWTWEPYFPVGKLVIIDGDGAAGKTMLLLDIIARMSTGREMPDGSKLDKPLGAVYVTFEDGIADTIKPRLEKAGANFSKIRVIKDPLVENDRGELESRPFSLSEDLDLLWWAIQEADAKLVVIDPILSAIDGDSYKDQEVRKALAPLVSFAEENGVTVVMVRHYSKQRTENINHKGIGSVAFINMPRVGLAVMPDPDDEEGKLLLHTKCNIAKQVKPLKYKIVDDGDKVPYIQWNGCF